MKPHPSRLKRPCNAPPPLVKIDYPRMEDEDVFWEEEDVEILEQVDTGPPPLAALQSLTPATDPYLTAIQKLSESVQLIHERLDTSSVSGTPPRANPQKTTPTQADTHHSKPRVEPNQVQKVKDLELTDLADDDPDVDHNQQQDEFQSLVKRKLTEIQDDLRLMNRGIQRVQKDLQEIRDHVAGQEEICEGVDSPSSAHSPQQKRIKSLVVVAQSVHFPLTSAVCEEVEESLKGRDIGLKTYLEERIMAGRFRKEGSLEEWFTVDVWDRYYAGTPGRPIEAKRIDIANSHLFGLIHETWSADEYMDETKFRLLVFGTAKRVRARKYAIMFKRKKK